MLAGGVTATAEESRFAPLSEGCEAEPKKVIAISRRIDRGVVAGFGRYQGNCGVDLLQPGFDFRIAIVIPLDVVIVRGEVKRLAQGDDIGGRQFPRRLYAVVEKVQQRVGVYPRRSMISSQIRALD